MEALAAAAARRQPVRFLVAGAFATAVNWASRFPLSLIFNFQIAVAIAYGIGMAVGFFTYRHWVFHGSQVRLRHQLWRFVVVNAVGLTTVIIGAREFLSLLSMISLLPLGLAEAVAHGLALLLAAVVNFVGHRTLTFSQVRSGGPAVSSLGVSEALLRTDEDAGAALASTLTARSAPQPTRRMDQARMIIAVFVIVSAHRATLWWLFGDDIVRTIDRNPTWLTWQFLPMRAYAEHFETSLFYLQQTPPIPHIVLGAFIKLFNWPLGVAEALFVLQALISAATSSMLFMLVRRIGCHSLVAFLLALWFGLSSDLYLMEINSFGQLFYESGGMLLVTATAVLLCQVPATPGAYRPARHVVGAGIVAGLAILTRASLSFFVIPTIIAVALRRGWRGALLFAMPILLLQGAWCLKNTIVYRHLTVATSSWSGINAANGLGVMDGYGTADAFDAGPFVQSILDKPERYPEWLVRVLKERGYVDWDSTFLSEFVPEEIRAFDAKVQSRMGGSNSFANSAAVAELSRQYGRAITAYTINNPSTVLKKLALGNKFFWQPIADYSGMFMGPLYVKGDKRGLIAGPYLYWPNKAFARNGDGDNPKQISLPALSLYPLDSASIAVFFVLLPITMAIDAVSRLMRRTPLLDPNLWVLIVIAGYGIAVSTSVDLGENMRFRLSFEPIIVAVTIGVLMAIAKRCKAIVGASPRAGARPVQNPRNEATTLS